MSNTERLNTALAGRYKIEKQLGQGGMATVYLAKDIKHDRMVAVKVLKPELAAVLGAERFVVEIKTTAALQHPHILPLFDSGTADGFLYYVMPYIEGETLRGKLNREKQFSVDEAVRITTQVADALDYAHRQGVIHRDIKPENILLHDGRPMVADFGIALAVSAAAGGRMTETGLSLGTPHYMSPEQATAEKEITGRSDIYSLASVMYEMLAGDPPHMGHSAQQIIMKIITDTARPVTELRKAVPPNVAAALAKALEKLPADRFETAKLFGEALMNRTFTSTTLAAPGVLGLGPRASGRPFIVAATVAAVAIIVAVFGWMRSTPDQPFRRYDLAFGDMVPSNVSDIAISPDGSMLAASGRVGSDAAIFVRRLDGDAEFRKLAGTESGVFPVFSPDGKWIVFTKGSDGSVVKISVAGGGAVTIVPAGVAGYLAHWGAKDQIVFTKGTGTSFRVSAAGGGVTEIPKVNARRKFLLPDGSGILYSNAGQILLYDFKRDTAFVLISGTAPTYVPTGHILYSVDDGGLFAVPFDLKRRRVSGEPVRVLERVGETITSRGYAVSAAGTIVHYDAPGSRAGANPNLFVIVDPGRGADTVRMPSGVRAKPRFSRDGRSIAMEVFPPARVGASDIYTLNLVTGTYTQLTFEGDNDEPVWSPDGKSILFDKVTTNPSGEDLFIKPADNSAPERRLTTFGAGEVQAQHWLDDKTLVFDATVAGRGVDAFTVAADSGSVPVPYLQSPFNESEPHLSPDRKMLVFTSNEAGGEQLWMRDFPSPQGKWNLSRGPARAPRWSPDGRFVYFWRAAVPDTLFRVGITRTPTVVVGALEPVAVLDAEGTQNWDLHPDGRRFIVAVSGGAAPASTASRMRYLILENWFGELRRITAANAK